MKKFHETIHVREKKKYIKYFRTKKHIFQHLSIYCDPIGDQNVETC